MFPESRGVSRITNKMGGGQKSQDIPDRTKATPGQLNPRPSSSKGETTEQGRRETKVNHQLRVESKRMDSSVANQYEGPSIRAASTRRDTVESKTSKAESQRRWHGQPARNLGRATGSPVTTGGNPSGLKATPELLERWEKARANNPKVEPRKILMEKEHSEDKVTDIYVKLPVKHVIQALDQAISENASGDHAENVMVPAKISTSIATSSREVYNVATVAQDAVFVNEPSSDVRFSKEELAQIYRAFRSRNASGESRMDGAHKKQRGISGHNTDSQNGQKTEVEIGSHVSSSALGPSTRQTSPEMASTANQQPDAKRPRLMEPKDETNKEDEDVAMADSKFSILTAFFRNAELTLELAAHLDTPEFLSLYAISKDFHETVNNRLTTTILAHARARAPESAAIFPFRCYSKLCIKDPAGRPHPVEERAATGEIRPVPSFRWLKMVIFRETVCREIMEMMTREGLLMPRYCELVLKKIWFLMDVPDNVRRVSIIRNPNIWSDLDLFFATMFFMKMDMRFTDPVRGSGGDGLRQLLLAQPSLSMFWKLLKGTLSTGSMDITAAYIRWSYTPRQNEQGNPLFGVPAGEVGRLQYEGWGRTGSTVKLYRPDDLVLMESTRRGLHLEKSYVNMFLWGVSGPGQDDSSGTWRHYMGVSNRP